MPIVKKTAEFAFWLEKLRDAVARARIVSRIERLEEGNFGDVAPVGNGISEMRIHHGAGYRVYFVSRGEELVILLCGGDKSSQTKDIAAAKQLAREYED